MRKRVMALGTALAFVILVPFSITTTSTADATNQTTPSDASIGLEVTSNKACAQSGCGCIRLSYAICDCDGAANYYCNFGCPDE